MTEPVSRYQATDDRKRSIAAAARQLIVEKGFEGLRTRDIAERVGINIATLHYHVPTKEALIGLVAQSLRDEFMAQHLKMPRDGMTPIEEMRQELDDFRDMRLNRPDVLVVLDELSRRARHDENVATTILPMKAKWRQTITSILERGKANGMFRSNLDTEAGTLMIIGAIVSFRDRPLECMQDQFEAVAGEILRSLLSPIIQRDIS